MIRFSAAVAAVFLAFGLVSCGNNIPEINQLNSRINFRMEPESGKIDVELLVLLNADDEDGEDDLEFMYIMDDKNELLWSVEKTRWTNRASRGMQWIGAEKLQMHDGGIPSQGTYRVLLVDQAGERAADSFFVPFIKEFPEEELYPRLIFRNDPAVFQVVSTSQANIISFHDGEGKLIGAFSVTPGNVRIERLENGSKILSDYRYLTVGSYNNSVGAGLITGPYKKGR